MAIDASVEPFDDGEARLDNPEDLNTLYLETSAVAQEFERNLLFSLLALQLNFISRTQLRDTLDIWLANRQRTIERILVDEGFLDAEISQLLASLVERHLQSHANDPAQSLAALSSLETVASDLAQIGDEQLQATLSIVGSQRTSSDSSGSSGFQLAEPGMVPGHRYRVIRPHAQGGLGQVSVAQDAELNREVALKEIQQRFSQDPASRSRFLLEAEITGGLEHPGIVPVYGLGQFDDGRPFYAMRFIRGDSLHEAIEQFHRRKTNANSGQGESSPEALGADPAASVQRTRQRNVSLDFSSVEFRKLLGRFVDVCQAIEYAHSRGVLHRDLKPGNIMLGQYGETLVVDWGLAKPGVDSTSSSSRQTPDESAPAVDDSHLTGEPLRPSSASGSASTQMGSILGTPAYMPPEQARGDREQLGPASDVYSLGATLYAILTGSAPYQDKSAKRVLELVKEGKLEPPSARLPDMPRALEAICLKAMARDPQQRYLTPQLLADDIERFLADEAVTALRENGPQRMRRWLRKHPRSVAAISASGLFCLLGAAAIATVVSSKNQQLQRAFIAESKARTQAERSAKELQLANSQIQAKELQVRQERDIALAINDFVRDDLLGQASPEFEPDREIKLRTVLDRAAASIQERFAEQPLVEAGLSRTIGFTYKDLGLLEEAEPFLQRASQLYTEQLGLSHVDSIRCDNDLAFLLDEQGRLDEAIERLESLRLRAQQALGADHSETQTITNNLAMAYYDVARYQEARELFESLLDQPAHSDQAFQPYVLNNLGLIAAAQGQLVDAEQHFRQAFEDTNELFDEKHPFRLTILDNLSQVLVTQKRYDEALPLAKRSVELATDTLTAEHPSTLIAMNNLAQLYQGMRRLRDARDLNEDVLQIRRRKLGNRHLDTLTSMNNLALNYQELGQLEKALPLLQECMEVSREILPENHPDLARNINNLGMVYKDLGRNEEAEAALTEALQRLQPLFGDDDFRVIATHGNLATVKQALGKVDDAESLFRTAIEASRRIKGDRDLLTLQQVNNLAVLLQKNGRLEEARQLLEPSLAATSHLGVGHPARLSTKSNLALIYASQGRYDDAALLYKQVVEARAKQQPGSPQHILSLLSLAVNQVRQAEYSEAEAICEKCLTMMAPLAQKPWPHAVAQLLQGFARQGLNDSPGAVRLWQQSVPRVVTVAPKLPADVRQMLIDALQHLLAEAKSAGNQQEQERWRTQLNQVEALQGSPAK